MTRQPPETKETRFTSSFQHEAAFTRIYDTNICQCVKQLCKLSRMSRQNHDTRATNSNRKVE